MFGRMKILDATSPRVRVVTSIIPLASILEISGFMISNSCDENGIFWCEIFVGGLSNSIVAPCTVLSISGSEVILCQSVIEFLILPPLNVWQRFCR